MTTPTKKLSLDIDSLTDYKQIEETLYYLDTLTSVELHNLKFKENLRIGHDHSLFTAMAYLASCKSSTNFNRLVETFGEVLDNNTRLLNPAGPIARGLVAQYILRLNNVYLDVYQSAQEQLNNKSSFKFNQYPDHLNSITYTNKWYGPRYKTENYTKYILEINRIEDVVHIATHMLYCEKTEDGTYRESLNYYNPKQLLLNEHYIRNGLDINPPELDPSHVEPLQNMFKDANLNITLEAKQWLQHWIYNMILDDDHPKKLLYPVRPDYELEALCSLLNLDYTQTSTKFGTLRQMGLLNNDNINSFVESLFIDNIYVTSSEDNLPFFD